MPHKNPADRKAGLAAYMKKRRAAFKARGLCAVCGKNPPKPPATSCSGCLESERAKQRLYRSRAKDLLFNIYGGPVCVCCGEDNRGFLSFDHKDGSGSGAAHRRTITKGRRYPDGRIQGVSPRMLYISLKKQGFPPVIQVLCFNCNLGRQLNGGVCPHKSVK